MKRDEMFDPGTRVDTGYVQLVLQYVKTGKTIEFPPLSCLTWQEDGREFIHCLEFDLIADGSNEREALTKLRDLIVEQVRSAQEEHTQLLHPAPQSYWDKFFEIHRNRLKQAFLDTAPTRKDIKVRELALTHV